MNVETLATILALAAVITIVIRVFTGWTLAGLLTTFVLACFGAVAGWYAQVQLALPPLYSLPFPGKWSQVAIVWPGLAALLGALLGARVWQPVRPRRRLR